MTEWQSDSNHTVILTISIISPSVVSLSQWVSHWVSELLTWDCKFGCTSQYFFNIILTLRCIRLHDAHWHIRTGAFMITGMTKYHLLQLEGSSSALPFCRSLTTWQVCVVRRDDGGCRTNAEQHGITTPRQVPRHTAIPSHGVPCVLTPSRSLVTKNSTRICRALSKMQVRQI